MSLDPTATIKILGLHWNPQSDSIVYTVKLPDQGVIKVGGRLQNANIAPSQKHPIVLPRNHHVTNLIIREEHIKLKHAGAQATLYGVREQYWPIDGQNVTRHIIHKCVKCFRAKPRGIDHIMGNLPEKRLCYSRPFLNVGVDYCGPFYIKEKRHRNRKSEKAYVSIFICFATKSVYLELVSDLTTEAFLGSLKRFFSSRGRASIIHSDNGKNFVGANRELKELDKFIQTTEAAVKSFKHHLTRTVGNTLLTYEQFQTYVIEIAAILNSRPLTPMSSDLNNLLPLSPGHFLIGASLTSFPPADYRNLRANQLSTWQHAQQMRDHFWSR
ncbi:uncharacterized protein LOC117172897 [Belonocnema kinseyi]|uniref:uncharacterized protein LOC117172897 n=1 Tax=Belonocnema kinseyi TaxID=2817044 RepID=UPI00143DDCEA|nr:uncharacterized protein LOC117172897 [Belonocnema kinseyi]